MSNTPTLEIRKLVADDIPQLIECIQRCYGDSYPIKVMYDKEKLAKIINAKQMVSVIAKNDLGQIIGHCALTFEGAHNTSPEAGRMFVDPAYRGHHISEEIAKKRVALAKELNLIGFWAACVTNHPYSQDEMITLGGNETGALLSVAPPDVVMKGLQNFSDSRRSVITFYLPLERNVQTIYVPSQHADVLKSLSQVIGLDREILQSNVLGSGKSILTVDIHEINHSANIEIHHIGADLMNVLSQQLSKLEPLNLAALFLNLPINQVAAAQACTELESMGFFWGAWIPNYSVQGDIFRLQKMNSSINAEEIICARAQGETLKKYVLSEWDRVSQKK
jgi:RimJ/RimL family protein N-acetyltransferase